MNLSCPHISKLICFCSYGILDIFCILLLVESVLPEWAQITVSLVLTFEINVLERMRIRFLFLSFKSW